MWVRQKIGAYDGQIVEMSPEVAKAAIASGTAEKPTDEEIEKAGYAVASQANIPSEDVLVAGYEFPHDQEGRGFNVKEPGGVIINKELLHNLAAARDFAIGHARATRSLPPLDKPPADDPDKKASGGLFGLGTNDHYADMNRSDLNKLAHERGVRVIGSMTNEDVVVALRHDDKVQASVTAGDYDELSRAELEALAARRHVDVSSAKNKGDIIDALKRQQKPTA